MLGKTADWRGHLTTDALTTIQVYEGTTGLETRGTGLYHR